MPETFPSTPRTPTTIRLCAVAIGLAGVALATRTTLTSSAWVGRTFPGFLLLVNRVVPSIGLAHWSGSVVADFYQSQVVALNGEPALSADQVYATVAATPPGTPIRYRLRKRGVDSEVTIPSQGFTGRDWVLLFGAYLFNSAVYLTSGLVVLMLRPYSPLARALLAFVGGWAFFFITAMDIYGPGTLTRLHAVTEPLGAAAGLQLFMLFPQPHRGLPGVSVSACRFLDRRHAQHAVHRLHRRIFRRAAHLCVLARYLGARAPACARVDARHPVRHRVA